MICPGGAGSLRSRTPPATAKARTCAPCVCSTPRTDDEIDLTPSKAASVVRGGNQSHPSARHFATTPVHRAVSTLWSGKLFVQRENVEAAKLRLKPVSTRSNLRTMVLVALHGRRERKGIGTADSPVSRGTWWRVTGPTGQGRLHGTLSATSLAAGALRVHRATADMEERGRPGSPRPDLVHGTAFGRAGMRADDGE